MSIIIGILTVLEVIVCLLLSLLVLMQRPRQEGLGATFGSGMTDQMFGAQTTNVLQKGTVYMGVALFALTFLLAVLTSHVSGRKSSATLVDSADLKQKPAATAPALPAPSNANKGAVTPAPADAAKPATDAKAADNKAKDAKPPEVKPTPAADQKPAATKPVQPAPATPAPAPAPQAPANK